MRRGSEIPSRHEAAGPAGRSAASVATINAETIAALFKPSVFDFRGRKCLVTRVPAREGLLLDYIKGEIELLMKEQKTRENLMRLRALYIEGEKLLWSFVKHRWWERNPFVRMTDGEFFAAVSFCSECRMKLPGLALGSIEGSYPTPERSWDETLPTSLRASPRRIPRGWRRMVGLSAMRIFGSGSAGSKWRLRVSR